MHRILTLGQGLLHPSKRHQSCRSGVIYRGNRVRGRVRAITPILSVNHRPSMNPKLVARFSEAYHKIYGITPQVLWDGTFYRSPHLPMAMSPRRLQGHVGRLEARIG